MRDLYAAGVWTAIHRAASNLPISQLFDMVAGTSGGAMIGAALVAPNPLSSSEITNFFIRDGKTIFPPDPFRYIRSAFNGPKYSAEPFEDLMSEVFGETWLSEVTVPFIVPAYDIGARQAKFFKSWKAQGNDLDPDESATSNDYRLRDVVRASAAAPTYFSPAHILSRAGEGQTFIDGALVANNPAMCAIASARFMNPDLERIILVSIGTGMQTEAIPYAKARSWGLLEWARPAFECVMDGHGDTVPYQVDQCFRSMVTQYRFDFTLGGSNPNGAIDDTSAEQVRRLIVASTVTSTLQHDAIRKLPDALLEAVRDRE